MKAAVRKAITVEDLRRLARRRLLRAVFDFVDGGAEDEVTMRANRTAWESLTFEPRVLVDVETRSTSTSIFGQEISVPVILGPTGLARLISPRHGELAVARAAGKAGTIYVVSTGSSDSLEDVAKAATGPLWFQLYLWRDRDLSESLVDRAAAAGYKALCLTVDVPVRGHRERELRHGLSYPPRIRLRSALGAVRRLPWTLAMLTHPKIRFGNLDGPAALGDRDVSSAEYMAKTMLQTAGQATWDSVAWLRERWKGPLIIKGVMTPADARLAVDYGFDGIVVSNHGGRQLDGLRPTASVLAAIADEVGKTEIMVDGGVRRGSDVVKAVALGARATLVGRPYLYGLGAGGEDGVARTLQILTAETDRTLALIGRRNIGELNRSALT